MTDTASEADIFRLDIEISDQNLVEWLRELPEDQLASRVEDTLRAGHLVLNLVQAAAGEDQMARYFRPVTDRMEDPEHRKSRRRWQCVTWPKIRQEAQRLNGVILFGDEVSFAQWGSLARTWGPRGRQPKIKTSGKRKGMKIFGVIEFHNGDFIYPETR